MHRDQTEAADADKRLAEVITTYLQAEGAGAGPDRQDLLAQNADLVPELTEFFATQDRIRQLVAPLRQVARAATVGLAAEDTPPAGLPPTAAPDARLVTTLAALGYQF